MAQSKRAEDYIYRLQVDERTIKRQLNGLTHEDTLLQPEVRGNCINWILGHLVLSRSELMERLGLEPIWGEAETSIYDRETAPITSLDCPHLTLDRLWEDFIVAGEKLVARLETITDDELDADYTETATLGKSVNFTIWHEGYHVGQFEYLRQLTGVNDKVI
jgi:uncharacterized damage-inducible protein DinB